MLELIVTKEIELVLAFVTFLLTTYLGFSVYVQNRKSWTHKLFALLAFLIDIYIVVNFLSLHPPRPTPENQLFWIRMVMFICSFIGPALLLLVHTFPKPKIRLKKKYLIALLILMTASAIASITNLVFKSIEYPAGQPMPIPGAGIPVFFLDFVGLFLVSFVVLIYKYKKAEGIEKEQHLYFLIGVLISFSLMGLLTVVMVVIFKTSVAVFLGPTVSVVLMAFIAYAIVRLGLFNMKVVAAKILVTGIIIVLLSKLFFFDSVAALIVDSAVLVVMMVFGLLLVKSVKLEIKQKEEVSQLAANLKRANSRLKELDQLKTEFMSIATHQLRTPLSIIKGYCSLLCEGAYGVINKKEKEVLNTIDISNERLIKLVDEFLNVSRIEQGRTRYNFAEMDFAAMSEGVVTELREKARPKNINLELKIKEGIKKVMADEERVRHCLYNFVDNAIKYSPEKTTIRIFIEKANGGLQARVVDEGVGLGKKDLEDIFQKFYRSPHVVNDFQGTGLGLFVVKQFVEAHGGKVWAKSKGIGRGSEFGFWIPLKAKRKPVKEKGKK